ncbi:MAG: DUF2892 domain-containing protein [Acidobacteriota bacterium]
MTIDNMLHLIAGSFIFVSVILGVYVSPYFLLFTGFVGLNLMQSAFTGWCPMIAILRMAGFKEDSSAGHGAVPRT